MRTENQYLFMKNLYRLLTKGYSLTEALDMMSFLNIKETKMIINGLNNGYLLSEAIKDVGFKQFVYDSLVVAEKSNKLIEIISLINEQYAFQAKFKKQFNKVLLYPVFLLVFSVICFEFIRINLYPLISSLLNEYHLKQNHLLIMLAFNLLKWLGCILIFSFLLIRLHKPLANIIPHIKEYRMLILIKHLLVLTTCGHSLEESMDILRKSLNQKIYHIKALEEAILYDSKLSPFVPYSKSLLTYFKLGLKSNNLVVVLKDFCYFFDEILIDKLIRLTYYVQFFLFFLLSVNIFLIYYLVMIPMFEVTNRI